MGGSRIVNVPDNLDNGMKRAISEAGNAGIIPAGTETVGTLSSSPLPSKSKDAPRLDDLERMALEDRRKQYQAMSPAEKAEWQKLGDAIFNAAETMDRLDPKEHSRVETLLDGFAGRPSEGIPPASPKGRIK